MTAADSLCEIFKFMLTFFFFFVNAFLTTALNTSGRCFDTQQELFIGNFLYTLH